MSAYEIANPVFVTLDQLKDGSIDDATLVEAFGPNSLGIIVVSRLPTKFVPLRRRALSYASHLGNLSSEELKRLECPEAKYIVGWSCGREMLTNNKPDTFKGSYYMNCAFYKDHSLDGAQGDYPNLPEYTKGNIWPREELLCGFKETMQEMACDRYAKKHIDGYKEGYLEHVVKTSTTTKARLLHYFPPHNMLEEDEGLDNWCGIHKDHGCLTGLTSAMYVDETSHVIDLANGVELDELRCAPDPAAGLYIKSRTDKIYKVGIPKDALAFQTGEALEVITEGKFKAVPHFVRGCRAALARGIARNTLAVFTRKWLCVLEVKASHGSLQIKEPNLFDMIDETRDFATFAKEIVAKNTTQAPGNVDVGREEPVTTIT